MPDTGTSSSLRILAPLALVMFAIAFFAVLLSSDTDEGDDGRSAQGQRAREARDRAEPEARRPRSDTYTVKTGDTLAGIAEKVGVGVERLQELNPELDPQALVSGQKIKLRE